MSYKVIRASEIVEYIYCRRAWWLSHVAGYSREHTRPLASGSAFHRDHGRLVGRAALAQRLAYALVFLAIGTFVFFLVRSF